METTEPVEKHVELKVKSKFYPTASQGSHIEVFHDLVAHDLEQIFSKKNKQKSFPESNSGHLTREEKRVLEQLKTNSSIVIRLVDIGGSIVIQDYQDYHAETISILSDVKYYKKISSDPFPEMYSKLQIFLNKALKDKIITKKEYHFILVPNRPFFNNLPKIHKDVKKPPGRPIISGINSSTCNLSHFLDLHLQDYVRSLPSYLKNTDSLIRLLKNQEWNSNMLLITMDVTALYSNIHRNQLY